ncbi:hypothetical protein LPJ61_000572, partial [Coemansia biformis]
MSGIADAGHAKPRLTAGERFGRDMPSSVMRRLGIKFYADIKRQRQQHGRRIRVLAVLSELRHLIGACSSSGDKSGRVYMYLEELNWLYMQQLRSHAPPLLLRSSACVVQDMCGFSGRRNPTVVLVEDSQRPQLVKRPVRFAADSATGPLFERALYSKMSPRRSADKMPTRAADTIDPCQPCWVDYLVDDLPEADVHGLFRLVARSRVPDQTHSKYRAAIEEALAFALNRRGCALDPLESMRVCAHLIRRHRQRPAGEEKAAMAVLERVLVLWRSVGWRCVEELRGQQGAGLDDDAALGEIRLKRWNNVASEAIVWQAQQDGELPAAWALLFEWHGTWTRAMQALCPERRRGFASGEDRFASPFWRAKLPGRLRLHELTLSEKAVCSVLARLADAGLPGRAAELLGVATSEAGIPVSAPMFNIVLRGLDGGGSGNSPPLPSLAALALVNRRALEL